MRRLGMGLLVVLGLSAMAETSQAQFLGNNNGDPFFLYYGFYLPRQAAMAAAPGPQATINALAARRQQTAITERASLYDPASPFGPEFDPSQPFANRSYGRRGGGVALHGSNMNGSGPSGHFNRTAQYFPGLRAGRGPSAAATVASGYSGGGGNSRMRQQVNSMVNGPIRAGTTPTFSSR